MLRLVIVGFLGKFVFPLWGWGYLALQTADSIILILLVAVVCKWKGRNLGAFFFKGKIPFRELIANGAWAGIILLVLGNWGETWVEANLLSDLGVHPLFQLIQGTDRAGQFVFPFLVGGFLVPLAEEVFYRGFLFPPLRARTGVAPGIVIASLVFALTHFEQVWFIEIFLAGLVLTWLYHRFQSLLPGLLTHIILNSGRLMMIYFAI